MARNEPIPQNVIGILNHLSQNIALYIACITQFAQSLDSYFTKIFLCQNHHLSNIVYDHFHEEFVLMLHDRVLYEQTALLCYNLSKRHCSRSLPFHHDATLQIYVIVRGFVLIIILNKLYMFSTPIYVIVIFNIN